MNETFKNKIRELREKHFPGQSLRGLSGELESQLGEHFYAYLSKIEAGALPSLDFLKKIRIAYKLTDDEYRDLFQLYARQKFAAESERSGLAIEPVPLLFRKTKKKKL
jgi:transcriptional regulator with XRE-family HTH domain